VSRGQKGKVKNVMIRTTVHSTKSEESTSSPSEPSHHGKASTSAGPIGGRMSDGALAFGVRDAGARDASPPRPDEVRGGLFLSTLHGV
jgi:hypothetical protein